VLWLAFTFISVVFTLILVFVFTLVLVIITPAIIALVPGVAMCGSAKSCCAILCLAVVCLARHDRAKVVFVTFVRDIFFELTPVCCRGSRSIGEYDAAVIAGLLGFNNHLEGIGVTIELIGHP